MKLIKMNTTNCRYYFLWRWYTVPALGRADEKNYGDGKTGISGTCGGRDFHGSKSGNREFGKIESL